MRKRNFLRIAILAIFSLFILVACDKTNVYKINFDSNNGSEVKSITFDSMEAIDSIEEPTKTGYEFDGWYFDNETFTTRLTETTLASQDKKEITVYAKWSLKKYTVSFNGNGGKCIEGSAVQKIEYGKEPIYPTFLKIGYTFTGWDKDLTNISSDVTANASYVPNKYVISFDSQGGTKIDSCNVAYEQELNKLAIPSNGDYHFGGFYTLPNGDGTQYYNSQMEGVRVWDIPKDTTLYAKWYQKVTFDKQNGSGGSDYVEAVLGKDMPSAQAPTLAKHTFMGYFTKENGEGVQYYDENMNSLLIWDKSEDITLYAYWTESEYTITFDKQGGYFGSDYVTLKYGETMPAAEKPQKSGYSFLGYYLNVNGEEKQYYDENMQSLSEWTIDNNATLYAKWELLNISDELLYEKKEDNTYKVIGYAGNDTSVIIPHKYKETLVTAIGENAFSENYNIEKISMPSTITDIGMNAFSNCIKLETIEMSPYITSIGEYAFSSCLSLEKIELPKTLENLPIGCFAECRNLKEIKLGSGINKIESNAFYNCTALDNVVLPSELEFIEDNAFFNCTYLENIQFPSSLKYLGNSVFEACTSLSNVELPANLINIGDSTFKSTNISNIFIPENVNYIGKDALYTNSIHNIFVSSKTPCTMNTNTYINNVYIFVPKEALEEYKNSNGWKDFCIYSYEDIDENGFLIEDDILLTYTHNEDEIIIPNNIVEVGDYAFRDVTGNISFEENSIIKTIYLNSFSGYLGKEIELPSSITSIDCNAFDYCDNLEIIHIGGNCKNVGLRIFSNTPSLKEIYLDSIVPPNGEGDYNYTNVNLYVPVESIEEYTNDSFWGQFNILEFPK